MKAQRGSRGIFDFFPNGVLLIFTLDLFYVNDLDLFSSTTTRFCD